MSIRQNITNYLKNGIDNYESGVSVTDVVTALLFLIDMDKVVLQVNREETIPYVRRILNQILGQPSFETERNELRYEKKRVLIKNWTEDDPVNDQYPTEQLFFVGVENEWEEMQVGSGDEGVIPIGSIEPDDVNKPDYKAWI